MKIPVKPVVKIGAYVGNVVLKPNITTDDGFNGYYNQRTSEIAIDDTLKEEKRDRTYLHEVAHMISFNYNIGLDERSIDCVANGMYELLGQLGIELTWKEIESTSG